MKISFSIIFYILWLFVSSKVFAQKNNGSITGKIFSADGSPAYVTVELKKLKKLTVTDNDGNFKFLKLPALDDTLIITSVESQMHSLPVVLEKNKHKQLGTIRLAFNIAQLQDIEIKENTAHSYKSDYSFLGTKMQSASINIPQSISAITKELIRDKMSFTLKDIATAASGVNDYSAYDEYTIRGFRAENARLINGLRGYTTTYVSPMLVNIERIEIVKGPVATLYGNSDPGGTINLVTKKPLAQKGGSIEFSGGKWDHYRIQGDITGPLNRNKTLLYRVNAGYDDTKSFRNHYFANSYQTAPSLSFMPNDKIKVNIDFSLSHIKTILDRGQPGFENDLTLTSTPINLIATQPGDFLKETDYATNVLFSYKISRNISFNSGYLNYITQQNTNEHGINSYITPDSVNLYFSTWNYHTATNTLTNYFTVHFNTHKISHQLLAGYDYIKSKVELSQNYYEDANRFGVGRGIVGTFSLKNPEYISESIDKYDVANYESDATEIDASIYQTNGLYIQQQMSVGKWKLLIGAREEFYRGAGDDEDTNGEGINENVFLPRIGLVYNLTPRVSLYATYNKGFDPFEVSTSTQEFDEPFKPIISELYELGAKANFFNNELSTSIAVYQLDLKNVAVNANDISNPDLYIQQGEDRSHGAEFEADGNILPNLTIAASYSYNITKVVKSKIAAEVGMPTANAPRHTSNTWITYTFTKGFLKGFAIAAGHQQVSQRYTLQKGLILPGYTIINAGLKYGYKHFLIAANFNNITNKNYWTGGYNTVYKWHGAPANFMISTGYSF